jgi:hypothetical protein
MENTVVKANNGKAPVDNTQIDKLVAQYRAIRKRIEQMEEEFERALLPFKNAKDKLAGTMLDFLDRTGQKSAKTNEGTVTATMRHTASLGDPDAFMDYVMKNGAFELMDRRANSTACQDFAEEHGSLPPGVKLNSIRTVSVRAPQ